MPRDPGQAYDFEGKQVWYRRDGRAAPIIFLPNATLTSKLWDHQFEHFRRTNDVIAVDLPGFGRSDRIERPTLRHCVEWLESFVTDLDLAPVTLVGNCLGSLTSLHYAARHPESVRAVVAMHTLTADVNRAGMGRFADFPNDRVRSRPSRWYVRHMPKRRRDKFFYVRGQFGRVKKASNVEYLEHARHVFDERSTRTAYFDLGRDIDSWTLPRWTDVPNRPPLCWIWGDANRLLPIESAKKQLEILQPDEIQILRDVGYAAAWEAPDEVNRIIEGFLAGAAKDQSRAPELTTASVGAEK